MSLIDLVKQELGAANLGHISNLIGADQATTETAISGALPALVGSLTQKATSADGASNIGSILGKLNTNVISNFGGILAGNNAPKLAQQGSSMLETIIGNDAVSGLSSAVSGFSGMGQDSSAKLLGVLGPITMGVMKQKLTNESGFDPSGLAGLVSSEQDGIAGALPEGFANHLGDAHGLLGNLPSLGQAAGLGGAAAAVGGVVSGLQDKAGDFGGVTEGVSGMLSGGLGAAQGAASDTVAAANERLGDIASGVVPDLSEGVAGLDGSVTDLAGNATQGLQHAASGAMDSATSTMTDGLSGLKDSATEAVSDLGGQLPHIDGLSESIQENLSGQADAFLDSATGAATDGLSGLQESASNAVSGLGESINDVGANVPGFGEVSENIAGSIQDKADGFLDSATGAATDGLSAIKDNAGSGMADLQAQLPDFGDIGADLQTNAADVMGATHDQVTDSVSSLGDNMTGAVSGFGDNVTDTVSGLGANVTEGMSDLKTNASEAVSSLGDAMPSVPNLELPDLGEATTNPAQGIQEQADSFLGASNGAASGIGDPVSSGFEDATTSISDTAADFAADAFNFNDDASENFDDFSSSASGMANDVREHLQSGASGAVNAAGDATSDLMDAGEDAMHTVNDVASDAAQQTKNAVGGATSGLTKILLPILVVAAVAWAVIYFFL